MNKNLNTIIIMRQSIILLAAFSALSLASFGQAGMSDNEKKYLVYTVQPNQKPVTPTAAAEQSQQQPEEEKVDSMNIWFPFHSLCDWQPGMRFMVIPDKKDLVIKTFAESSTGRMVSSASLLHKVMVYKGHDDGNGGLHEHVNFTCEETGTDYYYEVPTQSFDDYCFQKFGIPTLAYLGEVDSAIVNLKGRKLVTVADRYYIDDPKTSDGWTEIHDVPKDSEVDVVAVGVGTRSFPVKIVVRDNTGRQFFQNVAISKTNSGLRDEELGISNMIVHTFDGSFKLADDNLSVHPLYQKYVGNVVYTLANTTFTTADNLSVSLPRLTPLTVKKVRSQRGSEYAKMTLCDETGKTYTKDVLFSNKNRIGVEDPQSKYFVENIFALGNPTTMKGVRQNFLDDMRKGIVRRGFSADEVRLALGSPSSTGKAGVSTVWYYKTPSGSVSKKIYFNSKTMKVTKINE